LAQFKVQPGLKLIETIRQEIPALVVSIGFSQISPQHLLMSCKLFSSLLSHVLNYNFGIESGTNKLHYTDTNLANAP